MHHPSWPLLWTSLLKSYRAPSLMTSSVHQRTSILSSTIPHDLFCAPGYLNPIMHHPHDLFCAPAYLNPIMHHPSWPLFCAPAYRNPIMLHPHESWPLLCISLPQFYSIMLHPSWLLLCTSLPVFYYAPSLMISSVHQPTCILLCSIPHDFFCAPTFLS